MQKSFAFFIVSLLAALQLPAQGTISTVAGSIDGIDNIPATQTVINPLAFALDKSGNAYIANGSRIRVVNAQSGTITQVAQIPAQVLAVDADGQLLAETGEQGGMMWRVNPATGAERIVTSLSAFGGPVGLATDSAGNIFYCDNENDQIHKIDKTTLANTIIAGFGRAGHTGSPQGDGGQATLAGLEQPYAVTVDVVGNVFIADLYWLRRVDAKTGIITTIAGNENFAGPAGVPGAYTKAVFEHIGALTTDAPGNLYVADKGLVYKIDWNTGLVPKIAGTGASTYNADGVPALQANLAFITGLAFDAQGNLWLADDGNDRVFVIAASTGLIRTVAGTSANGDGGPAVSAILNFGAGLAATPQGDLYTSAGGIRRIDHATGTISTIYSSPEAPMETGGAPITVDSAGNVYWCRQNQVVRIDAGSGDMTTVAGTGNSFPGPQEDGIPAASASIEPEGVAIDSSGNLYIADGNTQRIRKVDAKTKIITTVAGNGQITAAYGGQTGNATEIPIGPVGAVAVAPDGDIYWATPGWILKLKSTGTLSVASGEGGGCIYAGDGGSALSAPICHPQTLTFDDSGNLFFSDDNCACVRRVDAQTGIIQTVAGGGKSSPGSVGIPATQAALTPGAIAWAAGSLYILDRIDSAGLNQRIRAVTPPVPPALPQPPVITSVTDAVEYGAQFSPGAVITLFGNYLGGITPVPGAITNGAVQSTAGGEQLTINGTAAPLLYVSAGQINAVIPYSTAVGSNATAQVFTGAGSSTFPGLKISKTSLSLFPNLIFNPDGTLNSKTNPAPRGGTLYTYGTGIGATNPAYPDGTIVHVSGPPYPAPVAPFLTEVRDSVTGATYAAPIAYLGPLPDFVTGAVQVNVQLPSVLPRGGSWLLLIGPPNATGTLDLSIPYYEQIYVQ